MTETRGSTPSPAAELLDARNGSPPLLVAKPPNPLRTSSSTVQLHQSGAVQAVGSLSKPLKEAHVLHAVRRSLRWVASGPESPAERRGVVMPDSEPDDIAHLADELDRSGADERVEALAEQARCVSDRIGVQVEPAYFGIEVPSDAVRHVVENFFPDGEPLVIRTYWK